ncbi:MAG: glycerophosphodiester phosphodiesterase [Enterobacterales bacterium]|nr:glycerophosphodiester phosphodiesterase [Enterobacterales bacterium]
MKLVTALKNVFVSLLLLNSCLTNANPSKESPVNASSHEKKIVIAHRGASGYLPEHSLAAKAMAHAMGADYIEQDVVMTKDDVLVVLHDPYLDRVTNVMQIFPKRFRSVFGENRWLAIDFTLAEIKTLKMTEGFELDQKTGQTKVDYESRFPMFKSSFKVSTLAEEIELIQGMNHSRNKDVGIYVEIKAPWFHQMEGKDISRATLEMIKHYGYKNKQDKVYLQCFDPDETKRIHDQLMPELKIDLKLILLIAETEWNETMRVKDGKLVPYSYDWLFEPGAMQKVVQYANGIGPWKPMIVSKESTQNNLIIMPLFKRAKAQGLAIHPYTFRKEPQRIPAYAKDFEDLLDIFLYQVGVDGVFTDFPDIAVNLIKEKG